MQKSRYVFIGKTLFFPNEKILAVGDLHLGYETALRSKGLEVPLRQFEEMKEELNKIIKYTKAKYGKIEKIIFLGDIKHSFSYEWKEKNYFNEVLDFLKKNFKENDIILIHGNHDTIDYSFGEKQIFTVSFVSNR